MVAHLHDSLGEWQRLIVFPPALKCVDLSIQFSIIFFMGSIKTIKKFELLDHDLSVESGELTPSMKVKRNVVEQMYAAQLDAMYA